MRESQQDFSASAMQYISYISDNGRSTLVDEPVMTFQSPCNENTTLPPSKGLVVDDQPVSFAFALPF
jgi:hypothetical protein